MIKIFINIHLFSFKQKIQVFQNNECIETIEVSTDKINTVIEDLSYKYPIQKIIFNNNNYLTKKYIKELRKYYPSIEITKEK